MEKATNRYTHILDSPLLECESISCNELGSAAHAGHLFAVLDPCGCEEILAKVLSLPSNRVHCLYVKAAFQEHWAVAPYLVEVDASTLAWIGEKVWEEPWGILAISTSSFEDLYHHFRKFLMVKDTDDNLLYFRFYDPRVLYSFLPTCDMGQLRELYGPISYFGTKDAQGGSLLLARIRES